MVCILELIIPMQDSGGTRIWQEPLGNVKVYSFIYLCLGNIYLSQAFISSKLATRKGKGQVSNCAFGLFSSLVIIVTRTCSVCTAKCLRFKG